MLATAARPCSPAGGVELLPFRQQTPNCQSCNASDRGSDENSGAPSSEISGHPLRAIHRREIGPDQCPSGRELPWGQHVPRQPGFLQPDRCCSADRAGDRHRGSAYSLNSWWGPMAWRSPLPPAGSGAPTPDFRADASRLDLLGLDIRGRAATRPRWRVDCPLTCTALLGRLGKIAHLAHLSRLPRGSNGGFAPPAPGCDSIRASAFTAHGLRHLGFSPWVRNCRRGMELRQFVALL
jgi:hypothetical protein